MVSNKEIAERVHRLIVNALDWLDSKENGPIKELYIDKKEFIIGLLERAVLDE